MLCFKIIYMQHIVLWSIQLSHCIFTIQQAIYEYYFLICLYYLESEHEIIKTAIKHQFSISFKIWKTENISGIHSAFKFYMNPASHLWVLPPDILILSWIWAGNFQKNGHKIANFVSSCNKISKESIQPSWRYDVE